MHPPLDHFAPNMARSCPSGTPPRYWGHWAIVVLVLLTSTSWAQNPNRSDENAEAPATEQRPTPSRTPPDDTLPTSPQAPPNQEPASSPTPPGPAASQGPASVNSGPSRETSLEGPTASSPPGAEPANGPSTASDADGLSLFLVLVETPLTREAVVDALEKEFRVPIIEATAGRGLVVRVEGGSLTVSFIAADGQVVERTMDLPHDPARQLDTIALLSGNLGRDEAGALLSELRGQRPPAEPPPTADPLEPLSAKPPPPLAPPAPDPKKRSPAGPGPSRLKRAGISASLTGDLSLPRDLDERRAHFEMGLVYSRVGALDGAAITFLASANRGADVRPSRGVQIALLWTQSAGPFNGLMMSLASSSQAALSGAQLTALMGIQTGTFSGAQLSALFTYAQGKTDGAQLAGLGALSVGDLSGVQMAGIGAISTETTTGVQMGSLFAVTGGKLRGAQLSALTSYAEDVRGAQLAVMTVGGSLTGLQLGVANVAYRSLDGLQVGLINYGGALHGTQVGLVNVAGKGRGTQVGLLNIAARNDGTSVGIVDIVPGLRTQLLTTTTFSPRQRLEGTPLGPLGFLGMKFLSKALYTHIGFGLGAEDEECTTTEGTCFGGGVAYAATWGLGLRARLVGPLFAEFDLSYQFGRSFNQSRSSQHSALLRSTLGVELCSWLALAVGAGPRLDFYEGPRAAAPPDVGVAPAFWGGVQFF